MTNCVVCFSTEDEKWWVAHFDCGRAAANYMKLMAKVRPDVKSIMPDEFREYSFGEVRPWTEGDIANLDDRSIQKVMREVDSQELAKALKGVGQEFQEKIFRNMSKRAAEMLREDMEYMGPIRQSDQQESLERIYSIVEHLVECEEIPDPRIDEPMVV